MTTTKLNNEEKKQLITESEKILKDVKDIENTMLYYGRTGCDGYSHIRSAVRGLEGYIQFLGMEIKDNKEYNFPEGVGRVTTSQLMKTKDLFERIPQW